MKVALVIERIESWRGGAETSTMEFAHHLAAAGHDVHIVTSSRTPSPPDLTIHMLSVSTPIRPLRTQAFIRKAAVFLTRRRMDLVHAITPVPNADVYQPRGGSLRETLERNLATRRTRPARLVKRFTTALDPKLRSLLELERRLCRPGGPVIVAVSDYVAAQFRRHYHLAFPRVRVVFNAVRVESVTPQQRLADRDQIRRQLGVNAHTLVLLAVAHNFRLKGIARLIDAVACLKRSGFHNFRVWIIGRDNPVPFQRRAVRVGVDTHVLFVGPTPRIPAFLHAADILVHPTYYDPCSRVVLEAMTRSVPPITTAQNGAAEVIVDGQNGFVVPSPDDIDLLAARIRHLADPATRRRIATAAHSLVPHLSMDRHVGQVTALYREIRDGRRSVSEK